MSDRWDKARKLSVLERMLVIRRFEESLVHLFEQKAFMAHYHLYIGQEATGVAIMETLEAGDRLPTTHRNHGHLLARGADPARAMAEILYPTTGLCNGYGGTLHLTDPDIGFLHTSSIVGGSIGLATGAAFALKNEGGDAVAVAFFGDGSLEEGISYEVDEFRCAVVPSGPLVCENNSQRRARLRQGRLSHLGVGGQGLTSIPNCFDMPVASVDGRNFDAVFAAASPLIDHARKRKGPVFLHAVTERWAGSKPLWPELPTGDTDIAMAWESAKIAASMRTGTATTIRSSSTCAASSPTGGATRDESARARRPDERAAWPRRASSH